MCAWEVTHRGRGPLATVRPAAGARDALRRAARGSTAGDSAGGGRPLAAAHGGAADARWRRRYGDADGPGRRAVFVCGGRPLRRLLPRDARLVGRLGHAEEGGDAGGPPRLPAAPGWPPPPGPRHDCPPAGRSRLPPPRAGPAVVHSGQSPAVGAAGHRPGLRGGARRRRPAGAGHAPRAAGHRHTRRARADDGRRAAALPGCVLGGARPAGGAVAARFRPDLPARRRVRAGPRDGGAAVGVPRP
jgi:hypothetical protein